VHFGANMIGGEWGHNPLPWPKAEEIPGPPCYCRQHGCLETYVSGTGLARDHEMHTGVRRSAEEILVGVNQNDKDCLATWDRYRDRLARGLSHVINLLDPDVIVLGGGLSKVSRIYKEVPDLWASYVFSDTVETKLLPPVHGDASGVRGAAWLWSPQETS
ncbi:MAG: ROK family protein, partial [Candidatus Eisenbacteria bacterium]|nr:ROK family protein [Candidatus Eisenbacteria bacterium]